jgi:hypothetical protein
MRQDKRHTVNIFLKWLRTLPPNSTAAIAARWGDTDLQWVDENDLENAKSPPDEVIYYTAENLIKKLTVDLNG